MADKHKSLMIIIAIVLIPVLLGMTPLNLHQKLSGKCQPCQGKQIQRASSCLSNSLVSQDYINVCIVNSAPLERELPTVFHISLDGLIHFNLPLFPAPLRC